MGERSSPRQTKDEVDVEFAVEISADSNLVMARAGGEANFRIALRWGESRSR